jgi:hypothetical protein
MKIEVPGAFWVAVLVALATIIPQYIDADWVPYAVFALGAVAKLLDMYFKDKNKPLYRALKAEEYVPESSKLVKFLFG